MFRLVLAAAVALAAVASTPPATGAVVPNKRIVLFNGKDLTNLTPVGEGSAKTWSAKDGVLSCRGTPVGYIRTDGTYRDYRLHVEWRWPSSEGNSGVLVHCTGPDKVFPKCLEPQLKSGDAGHIYQIGATFKEAVARKDRFVPRQNPSSEYPLRQWNTYDIVCKDDTVTCFVNGVFQNHITGASVSGGQIGLQSEGAGIQFRNMYIEPIGAMVRLFNGRDLKGLKVVARGKPDQAKTLFSVVGGVLRCTGQPFGYIRTEGSYSNYELTVQWRWPDGAGNSGVLLHGAGADVIYPKSIECQLWAGKAGDFYLFRGATIKESAGRKRPLVPKQKPASEKVLGQWNTYRIVARGDTVACYVNGVLQNTATEASVTKGWICLQSEGKPVEFRDMFIRPLK